jgi:hypothetical protein
MPKGSGKRGQNNSQAKLTEAQVREIKQLISQQHKHIDIAQRFKVSRSLITRIGSGTAWAHIQ